VLVCFTSYEQISEHHRSEFPTRISSISFKLFHSFSMPFLLLHWLLEEIPCYLANLIKKWFWNTVTCCLKSTSSFNNVAWSTKTKSTQQLQKRFLLPFLSGSGYIVRAYRLWFWNCCWIFMLLMQLAYTSLDLFAKIMLETGFRLLMGGMFSILGYHFKSQSPWRVNKVHTWKQPHEQRADLSRCSSCAEHGSEEERRLRSMIGIRSDGGLGIASLVQSSLLM